MNNTPSTRHKLPGRLVRFAIVGSLLSCFLSAGNLSWAQNPTEGGHSVPSWGVKTDGFCTPPWCIAGFGFSAPPGTFLNGLGFGPLKPFFGFNGQVSASAPMIPMGTMYFVPSGAGVPMPAMPADAGQTAGAPAPVVCNINEVQLLSQNVDECEKAGGSVAAQEAASN